jgi:hypothetical protein
MFSLKCFSESFVSIKLAIGKMVVGGVNLKYRMNMSSNKVMLRWLVFA